MNIAEKTTVYVVDDDASVRHSVGYLMESIGLQVVSYSSSRNFLDAYIENGPACMILDLRMPDISGLETLELIHGNNIQIPIIIITGHGDVPAAVRAMKLGVLDFLEKPCSDQVLLERVQKAIEIDRARLVGQTKYKELLRDFQKLSIRENDVMNHIVAGKSNKETARLLNVSPKTIESHRANLMRKLNVHSLAELVQLKIEFQTLDQHSCSLG